MQLNWFSNDIWSATPASIAFGIVLAAAIYYYFEHKDLPPGPIGLPYLGIWPFLNSKTSHFQLHDYKKKYGDIYSFTITGRLYINLGTTKAVREAHVTKVDCFTERPGGFSLFSHVFGEGLVYIGGEQWKTLRKFFLNVVRERGMGALKDSMSGPFYDCINTTIDELKGMKEGEPLLIVKFLTEKCNTIMRLTLFGEIGASDEQIKKINEHYEGLIGSLTGTNFLLNGNIARYFMLPFLSGYREMQESHKKIEDSIYKLIKEHESTFNQDHLRDLIDDYIMERNIRKSKGDPTAKHFTDKALISTLVQIIGDGVLSVASFIALFVKVLLDNPEEQDKICRELNEVIGPNRQPTVEDKSKLTYTNAFIQETLRTNDFFPYFPSLECTKETKLGGYRIPKGAITLMNIFSAHNDPETYANPEKFDPSRFISTDGKRKPELPIGFGIGRRACIGEGFTMTQVFIFLTSLMKNFHFTLPEGTTESTFDLFFMGKLQLTVTPRN